MNDFIRFLTIRSVLTKGDHRCVRIAQKASRRRVSLCWMSRCRYQ